MNSQERIRSERDEIIEKLSKKERWILYEYEKENGRLYPGAICKVIEDQREIARERRGKAKRKK